MKKKFLVIASILILIFPAYSGSIEPELPSLPVLESENSSSEHNTSLWDKILGFFGLNNQASKEDSVKPVKTAETTNNSLNVEEKNKDTLINSSSLSDNIPIQDDISKDKTIPLIPPSKELINPTNNIDNAPPLPQINNLPDPKVAGTLLNNNLDQSLSQETISDSPLSNTDKPQGNFQPDKVKNNSAGSDLKLPEGFDPDEEEVKDDGIKESNSTVPEPEINNHLIKNSGNDLPVEGINSTVNKPVSELKEVKKDSTQDELKQETVKLAPNDQQKSNTSLGNTLPKITPPPLVPPINNAKITKNSKNPSTSTKSLEKMNSSNAPTATLNSSSLTKSVDNKQSISSANVPSHEIIKEPSSQEGDSEISKYRKQLQDRLNKSVTIPEIKKEDRVSEVPLPTTGNAAPANSEMDSAKQIKFTTNEVQVLMLPNDDIVLGELTQEAYLDLIDFSAYVKIFWDNYDQIKDEPQRKIINNFIENYNNNLNNTKLLNRKQLAQYAFSEAFDSIENGNIYNLIGLLDNYPILQLTDQDGNTLLHKAVYEDNYSAAKLLIMKGINLFHRNNQNKTVLDIALSKSNSTIITLLKFAERK